MPLPEEAPLPVEHAEGTDFRVVSLNLGGRNTNPVEFEMKGDSSEAAAEAMAILRNAGKALKSAKEGPGLMPPSEMEVVEDTLTQIFEESGKRAQHEWQIFVDSGKGAQHEWHCRVQHLFRSETWAQVISSVRSTSPHLFNALNLCTLKLNRPSIWENPSSCKDLNGTKEYLLAWKQWHHELDRTSKFWLEDAPRVASKRGLDAPTAFAGLLLFDVMCLCTARCSMPSTDDDDDLDGIVKDTRDVPFEEISGFAARFPASSLAARHASAQQLAQGAHALLAQEARSLADHPAIEAEFLPPIYALDGFTAIFLRKDSFNEMIDITAEVAQRMEDLIDAEAPQELQRAWRTTASRLAAVSCECPPRRGGFRACLVSLHMSKSDATADFIEKLRDVLANYDADINVVGMDSNCAAKEATGFQKRLSSAGFDIGCKPGQQQVTVAKQRTAFQTQTQKVGDVDISHKDYILTWASPRVRRGRTTYMPDLRTSYGVEQETKQCVRLPTTTWPFDHCSVATSFQPRFKRNFHCDHQSRCACVVALLALLVILAPLASVRRESPYGQPGQWFHEPVIVIPRVGICEGTAPCPEGWVQGGGSCYRATPEMGYPDVERFCQDLGTAPVTIESEAENQLLLQSLCPTEHFCYIGLRGDFAGKSYWASGVELNFTRLVQAQTSLFPIWENSRSNDYVATLLSNMPGDVTGCDVRFTMVVPMGPFEVDVAREFVAPVLAMVWSGVLLVQRRSGQQRFASSLLLMSFCANFLWAGNKMLSACFVDDFLTHLWVQILGKFLMSGGIAATSILSLWMIVRRMGVLYPSSRGFKLLFSANLASTEVSYLLSSSFLDFTAPMAPTWAVVLTICASGACALIYVLLAAQSFWHLRRTWDCLQKEATSGCGAAGSEMAALVRAARLHIIAVPLAILTGALRWTVLAGIVVAFMYPEVILPIGDHVFCLAIFVDSITNDFCTHMLAVLNMDEAVVRARGVTTEIVEREEREVEQHRLAVRMLKAAPTSVEQLHQLSLLEGKALAALGTEDEGSAFLILKSAVRVETARIHRLMQCVRVRAMTMGVRYQFLIDVEALEGSPRQHVPERFATGARSEADAEKYLDWLYSEADGAQEVLFQRLQHLLAKFNAAVWPSDLGLAPEEFPWRIWAGSHGQIAGMKRLPKGEAISPGDTLIHSPPRSGSPSRRGRGQGPSSLCIVLEETPSDQALIHRSGMEGPEQVPRDSLRTCTGGGVFIPGPQKKRHRSLEKIAVDYRDSAPWPAAASLVDICRCMLLCDDPYAMAVLVAYLRRDVEVLRVKNRFCEDVLEPRAAEELQTMFYAASASDTAVSDSHTTTSFLNNSGDRQYRDISMNCVIRTPTGAPFVCEVQVTLSNLAILKHADQRLYTIRRMKSPKELSSARVFFSSSRGA